MHIPRDADHAIYFKYGRWHSAETDDLDRARFIRLPLERQQELALEAHRVATWLAERNTQIAAQDLKGTQA